MGWSYSGEEPPDYARMDYVRRAHRARYRRYVKQHGLTCQECGGAGGWVDRICELGGPWESCGFCEGTGLVTRHMRGLWLRWKRDEKCRRAA